MEHQWSKKKVSMFYLGGEEKSKPVALSRDAKARLKSIAAPRTFVNICKCAKYTYLLKHPFPAIQPQLFSCDSIAALAQSSSRSCLLGYLDWLAQNDVTIPMHIWASSFWRGKPKLNVNWAEHVWLSVHLQHFTYRICLKWSACSL